MFVRKLFSVFYKIIILYYLLFMSIMCLNANLWNTCSHTREYALGKQPSHTADQRAVVGVQKPSEQHVSRDYNL